MSIFNVLVKSNCNGCMYFNMAARRLMIHISAVGVVGVGDQKVFWLEMVRDDMK